MECHLIKIYAMENFIINLDLKTKTMLLFALIICIAYVSDTWNFKTYIYISNFIVLVQSDYLSE